MVLVQKNLDETKTVSAKISYIERFILQIFLQQQILQLEVFEVGTVFQTSENLAKKKSVMIF